MATLYYESSICHHGIRGQRWGVRRYQNPDGSLTPKGRDYYKTNKVSLKNVPKDSLALSIFQNHDSVIPKGTKVYRVTNNANEDTSNRKYVSFLRDDRDKYEYDSELFPGHYLVEYTITKDINVAGGVEAFDARINTNSALSNTKIKQIITKNVDDDLKKMYKSVKNRSVDEAWKSVSADPSSVSKFITMIGHNSYNKYLDPVSDSKEDVDYYNRIKDDGYDAVLDIADSITGFTRYPIAIVNSDSYKVTKVTDMDKRPGGRKSYY